MRPEKPVLTGNSLLPVTFSLVISAGAMIAWPTFACTGMRTVLPAPVQVRLPNCQTSRCAVVAVSFTVKLPRAPGASVRLAGVTWAVKPGTEATAL